MFLWFLNKEKANSFWDRIFDTSDHNWEIWINSLSHFIYEWISTTVLLWSWSIVSIILTHTWTHTRTIWVLSSWSSVLFLTLSCFYYIILHSCIVCEQIMLFGIDNSFNYFFCSISFLTQALDNDIHNLWNHCWESLEDFFHNALAHLLQLRINIVQ